MKEFEKHSIVLLSLTMAGNIFNLLLQIIMGRMLDIGLFGTMNTLFSLSAIVSLPAYGIFLLTSKYVSEYSALELSYKPILKKMFFFTFVFVLFFLLLGIGLSGFIGSFFNIENSSLILLVIISAGVLFILHVITGGLQGEKRFLALGIVGLLIPFTKLFGSIIFVSLGFELFGILLSNLFGIILSILTGFWLLKLTFNYSDEKISFKINFKVLQYSLFTFFVTVILIILTNIDIIIVSQYFTAEETGFYSTASILCKSIFFISSSILFVMFPLVTEAAAKKTDTVKLLIKTFFYCGSLSAACVLVFYFFSKPVITILFGSKYMNSIDYILPVSIWIIGVMFITVFAHYSLAVNRAKHSSVSLFFICAACFVLPYFIHTDISQIFYSLAAISFGILGISILLFFTNFAGRAK